MAASTARRRGAAVNVTWISPVLYSALNASTPSTLTAITAYSRLMTPGSSGSGGGPWPGAFVKAKATTALTAIGVTTATSRDQKVERTERNLVHSDPSRSSARMARDGGLIACPRGSRCSPRSGPGRRLPARPAGVPGRAPRCRAPAARSPMAAASRPVTTSAPSSCRVTVPPRCAISSASSAARGERTSTSRRALDSISSAVGTSASSRPRPMMTRWSAVCAISLIRWLETRTVRPSAASSRKNPRIQCDALRVQAVDRLVEHQHRRVAEQRGGDAEPLLHAERETADPAPGHRFEPGQPQHLGDALPG